MAEGRGPWSAGPWPAVALACILRLANGPLTVDDAYITFRYARNLAEGSGFAYNPGEPVLGTTTPLWALLLAGLHRATGLELPSLAWVLNTAFDAATAGLLVVLVRRLGGGRGASLAAGLLFAAAPMSVAYAAAGMEASLLGLLLCLAGLAASGGRMLVAAALVGLATLTRPEGALAALLVLGEQAWRARRLPVAPALVYLGVLAPWLVCATLIFGGPLPQTMVAKAAAYLVDPLANALALALQPGLPGLSLLVLAGLPAISGPLAVAALAISAAVGLFSARLAWRLVRERQGAALALFPIGYVLAYALAGLRGVRMFHWYLVPLVPFYCAALGLAVERLAASRLLRGRAWLAYGGLALWWLPGFALLSTQPSLPLGFTLERERVYREIAAEYREAWTERTLVAAPEIGTLGYYSRARILDSVGLVSPQSVSLAPLPPAMLASDNAISPALVQAARPDYVVSLDQFVSHSLLPDPWFARHYELVDARPARVWSSQAVLVFRRVDAADAGPRGGW